MCRREGWKVNLGDPKGVQSQEQKELMLVERDITHLAWNCLDIWLPSAHPPGWHITCPLLLSPFSSLDPVRELLAKGLVSHEENEDQAGWVPGGPAGRKKELASVESRF